MRFEACGRIGLSKDASAAEVPTPPEGVTPLQDFEERLRSCRSMILDLARPRLKETFLARARACIYSHSYENCVTYDDYVRECKSGIYDNNKRALIHHFCNQLWGKQCAEQIELQVMAKMRLQYKNQLLDGKDRIPKNARTHGSIRKMINRLKQSNYIDRFRYANQKSSAMHSKWVVSPMLISLTGIMAKSTGRKSLTRGSCRGHRKVLLRL